MGSNIIELAKLGHERAAELKASCGAVDVHSVVQLISDLATQLEVQLVRGNEQAVQLANAESKCSELAAENTRAKKIISECREYFIAGVMNRIRPTNEGYLHMICDTFEDETPATDAVLAEVRASELDSLAGVAETMLVKFSNQSCSSDMHEVVGWKMVLQQATNRAAQLRKGAAL